MRLRHVVITSVNRDDLADGGSEHFAATVREVRARASRGARGSSDARFSGRSGAVARVLDAGPHVFNHNMETVRAPVRTSAASGELPAVARRAAVREALPAGVADQVGRDARPGRNRRRSASSCCAICAPPNVDVATLGQYLQPTRRNLPVAEYRSAGAVRRVSRLRPVAGIQDGVQRTAGAQLVHGGSGQRASSVREPCAVDCSRPFCWS